MSSKARTSLVAILAILAIALLAWARNGGPDPGAANQQSAPDGSVSASATPQRGTLDEFTVAISDLPPEAIEVIGRLEAGGPFAFAKDGSVFGNREKLLPLRERGYYLEYTVVTPGSPDRGARRIVSGGAGELYYTADHYQTFRLIVGTS